MTKKHYNKMAAVIKRQERYDGGVLVHLPALLEGLFEVFVEDNPAFDRDRFVEACGTKDICHSEKGAW